MELNWKDDYTLVINCTSLKDEPNRIRQDVSNAFEKKN